MSVRWLELRKATVVTLVAVSGAVIGCRAAGSEQDTEAGGDVVIERVSDPLRVVDVELGRAIGPDNRVIDSADEFQTNDTIYASIVLVGSANEATLKARWTEASGEVVDETVRTVTPAGETITEFHIVQPAGWQRGKYRVEILLDGTTVGRQDFEVS